MSIPTTGSFLPTFLLLGAAKSGTSSLAYYLAQHPEICFSDPKEPVFFEAEYAAGLEHYRSRYFRSWKGEPAVGEGRVWNLYLPFVAARVRESVPDARLIVLLRDPVERSYSHWWHRYSRGQEQLDFEHAVAEDRARIERGEGFHGEEGARRWRAGLVEDSTHHRALLDLGFYADQLERYLALFPASQLKVLFYDDLVADPGALMCDLFGFVGVDPGFGIEDATPQNVQRDRLRGPRARRLLLASRSLGLRHLVPRVLRPALHRLAERRTRRPQLSPTARRELIEYFEPHTARLERLVGRTLPGWRAG